MIEAPETTESVPVPEGTVARRVAASTGVQVLGKAIVFPLGFIGVALSTRYLGQRRFGELTTITVYTTFLMILTEWGLSVWSVRELARAKVGEQERLVGGIVGLRLVLATVGSALGVAVSFLLPYPPVVRLGIALSTVAVILGALTSTLSAVLQTRLRMTYVAVSDVVRSVVYLLLIVTVIAISFGVLGFVGAAVIASFASLIVVAWGVRKLVWVSIAFDRDTWRTALVGSLALGAAFFIHTLYFRVDTLLLSLLRPPEDVGIYGFAYRFFETLLVLPALFTMSVLPIVSKDVKSPGADLRKALQRSFDALILGGLPLAVGGFILAPQLTRFLAGAQFAAAATPLRLLLVGLVFSFVATLVGILLIAADRQRTGLVLSFSVLVINCGLNLALIPPYGYNAAATLTAASEAFVAVVGMVLVGRVYGFWPKATGTLLAVGASAAMGATVWALREQPLAVPLLAGAAVYSGVLLLSGGLPREIVRELLSRA